MLIIIFLLDMYLQAKNRKKYIIFILHTNTNTTIPKKPWILWFHEIFSILVKLKKFFRKRKCKYKQILRNSTTREIKKTRQIVCQIQISMIHNLDQTSHRHHISSISRISSVFSTDDDLKLRGGRVDDSTCLSRCCYCCVAFI